MSDLTYSVKLFSHSDALINGLIPIIDESAAYKLEDSTNSITKQINLVYSIIMEMKMYQDWLKIIPNFNESTEGAHCPNCNSATIGYQFVGDSASKIGHLYLWCNTCLHGIHMSRVKIPDGVEILPFDAPEEVLIERVPKYKLIQ